MWNTVRSCEALLGGWLAELPKGQLKVGEEHSWHLEAILSATSLVQAWSQVDPFYCRPLGEGLQSLRSENRGLWSSKCFKTISSVCFTGYINTLK